MLRSVALFALGFTVASLVLAQPFPKPPVPWQDAYDIDVSGVQFVHPMTVVNPAELAFVKQRISQGAQPQTAAYATALAYLYNGNPVYAEKAREVLNAWADKDTRFSGADSGLQLGSYFNPMLYAADILMNYDGWTAEERAKFESWWRLRVLENGEVIETMRVKDNNWKDAGILGVITAAVVFEDRALLEEALIQQISYLYPRTVEWEDLPSSVVAETDTLLSIRSDEPFLDELPVFARFKDIAP